jgi:N-acetylglucosaminyldiphosphoundecaprenol N-acetyl-beta-D-mannosaminyltransferase
MPKLFVPSVLFLIYAGTVERPSSLDQIKIRMVYSLIKEPKRLWKRYLYYGPVFIKLILAEKIKQDSKS